MKYKVIRSKRKTVSINIINSQVIVKAPLDISEEKIEAILVKHSRWIKNALIRAKRKEEEQQLLSTLNIPELKENAEEYFKQRVEFYSNIMNLFPQKIKITSAQKRFGSCNSHKTVCFSYRLMLYPEAARDYVVVHELAHLKEMNHSKRFYEIIKAVMPDYKERMRLLK